MISRCKFCRNGFFITFFPLSHICHFESRPSPLSKIGEMHLVRTFCSSTAKTSTETPFFLFHDFNEDSASFRWEKIWHKSMFRFLAILLNCTDWAITGRIARVQFNSTLEPKVKTKALQGIFLVRQWIKNTLKSNSVQYHMHHRKNISFLSIFGLRAVLWRQNEHGDPHFLLLFRHLLDLFHHCTKFHLQSVLGSFTKESP